MERKSITLIATSDINYDQRLQKVAESLNDLGAEVCLIGRELNSSVALSLKAFQQKRLTCIFNKGVLFYLEMNLRLFMFLLKNKSEIVVVNDVDTAFAGILISWFRKVDVIFDAHEYFTEVPELKDEKIKKKVWAFLEKIIIKKSKARYTVNESLAKIFEEKYQQKFEIISNVPTIDKARNKVKKENYILYQGALNKGRGLEALIEAMQQVDGQLKIAGKGDLEIELKKMVSQFELHNKIEFLGNLKPEDLKKVTQKAKIGINLLEANSLNYYYSLANKFFDYIHADLPQICMNFPEYKSINNQFEVAVLIENLAHENLINKLNNLFQNEALYLRLQNNCKSAKDVFNWEKETLKLKNIYQLD